MPEALTTKQDTPTIKAYFNQETVQKRFTELLGAKSKGFITSVLQITSSGALAKADPVSVYNAACTAAILDLPINNNLGFAYIVPFGGKAQFQLGYKGFIQLAQRSGQFKTISATPIYEGQLIEENPLTGFKFDFTVKKSQKVIGYASYFQLLNGFEKTLYMTIEEMDKHGKKFSQTYKQGYGVWKDDFDSMALKTVIKLNLSKFAPLSIEMQKAVLVDQSVIEDETGDKFQYADNADFEESTTDKELERAKALIQSAKTLKDLEKNEQVILQAYPELQNEFETKRAELSK